MERKGVNKMFYIYLTTNNINGKQYIGQHKGALDDNYLGSGLAITEAIKKYGKENFSKVILCECASREEADQKEKEMISQYNAVADPNFYNLQEGGTGGDGWRACQRWMEQHPEEAKQIYRENHTRLRKWWEEHPEAQEENNKKLIINSAKWRKEHPDKVQETMKKVNEAKEQWQREHPEEYQAQVARFIKAGSDANSQRIRCITTGEIFTSQSEAGRTYGIPQSNISKVLKGERRSAGKHPQTGEKLFWEIVK